MIDAFVRAGHALDTIVDVIGRAAIEGGAGDQRRGRGRTEATGETIGEMAEVSKSSVSRRATEAAGERLKELAERRLDDRDDLVVYIDGVQFAGHHVLVALGVDTEGNFSSASGKAQARMRPWP